MGTARPRPTALDETPATRWETRAIKALSVLSKVCWIGAVILYIEQRMHPGFSSQALIIAIFWDLSIASLATGLAPHLRGADGRTALTWRAVRKLPEADRMELTAYSHRRPLAARAWVWRVRWNLGVVCWALAVAYTVQVETGVVHVALVRLIETMVLLQSGGVTFTVSALVGIDRARHDRTIEIALSGPANVAETVAALDPDEITAIALDEGRDDTGQFPAVRRFYAVRDESAG